MKEPRRSPILILLLAALVPVLFTGCSGDDDERPLPDSTWYEDCNACGSEWAVQLTQGEAGPEFTVAIANTGERGRLRIRFGEIKGYALNEKQAASWRETYPEARAARDAIEKLEANGYTPVTLVPRPSSEGTFTIAKGQAYGGVFLPKENSAIPSDTAGLVLMFGPIDHEITPAGLAATDNWVTWDATRPYFTIGPNTARITPVAPSVITTPRPPVSGTPFVPR